MRTMFVGLFLLISSVCSASSITYTLNLADVSGGMPFESHNVELWQQGWDSQKFWSTRNSDEEGYLTYKFDLGFNPTFISMTAGLLIFPDVDPLASIVVEASPNNVDWTFIVDQSISNWIPGGISGPFDLSSVDTDDDLYVRATIFTSEFATAQFLKCGIPYTYNNVVATIPEPPAILIGLVLIGIGIGCSRI